jgi:hypothetical protein
MSELKPYRVRMNGWDTTLLLSDDDAELRRSLGQEFLDDPAEVVAVPAEDLEPDAAPAEVTVGEDGIPVLQPAEEAEQKEAAAPPNKARRATNKH